MKRDSGEKHQTQINRTFQRQSDDVESSKDA